MELKEKGKKKKRKVETTTLSSVIIFKCNFSKLRC